MAMAERGARVAMVDLGTQVAMAERGAWEAMTGSPPQNFSWGFSSSPGGALEALSLGALGSRTEPAGALESRTKETRELRRHTWNQINNQHEGKTRSQGAHGEQNHNKRGVTGIYYFKCQVTITFYFDYRASYKIKVYILRK